LLAKKGMNSPRRSTPKSIRSRQAIEAAAKDLFAINGFERTTVREIGARAGIDPSMVIRYFGSKDALFARVAAPDLQLPDLGRFGPESIGETLVRHFLAMWEGEQSGGGLPILLRSAASNDEAASRLREVFRTQVFPVVARAGSPETAPARAALVASQLLGLALTRYILNIPPMVQMSREQLVREIGPTIQRYASGSPSEDSA
jgi:AcrR family transcriptional regulator